MLGRGLYAKLRDDQILLADRKGRERYEWCRRKGRRSDRKLTPEQQLAEDIEACRCELAGWVCFQFLRWCTELVDDPSDLPDLVGFSSFTIDVKGIKEDRLNLVCPGASKLHRDWYYLLVSSESHPYYWLPGWMRGDEIADGSFRQDHWERPAWLVRKELLHGPCLLQQIARKQEGC